ncbi:hypothetical protein RHS04_01870 [Rhizoctonia solani]|uniref:Uncharacterized protein n=1 Tax=Rhizoctonia solani TaxID=456999 RepID=A0A8H7HC94_9AGAM|nr:hypothetical protein RHS04_01870 [Rhizoctonia solani]
MTRLNIPLFVALAASLLSAVPANGRDTLPHQRMIRKRGPPVAGPGAIGAAAVIGLRVRQLSDDLLPTASSASSSAAATPSTTTTAAAATTTTTSSSSTSAAPTTATTPTTTSSAVQTTSSSSSTSVGCVKGGLLGVIHCVTQAAQTTSTGGGLLDPLTSLLGLGSTSSTTSTTTTSSTPTTTSTSSTTSAAPTPTTTAQQAPQTTQQAPAPQTTPTLNLGTPTTPTPSPNRGPVTTQVFVTTSLEPSAAAAASQSAKAQRTKTITKNTIIVLVVIAACIGGAMAIWTVIRKWKLSPSEKFDDRMQPIDWTPPTNGIAEDAIEEKTKHRRVGSGASHGSFTSGGVPQSDQGHGAKAGTYADSQRGHGYGPQDFPPPHDFTAGAAQPDAYGQYYGGQQYAGGPGYADLQRGPSVSESTYSHGASVSRGLSYSRGHAAYDSQSGAVPPMPNPYGGEYAYEDYAHPPAGQAQGQAQAPYRAF